MGEMNVKVHFICEFDFQDGQILLALSRCKSILEIKLSIASRLGVLIRCLTEPVMVDGTLEWAFPELARLLIYLNDVPMADVLKMLQSRCSGPDRKPTERIGTPEFGEDDEDYTDRKLPERLELLQIVKGVGSGGRRYDVEDSKVRDIMEIEYQGRVIWWEEGRTPPDSDDDDNEPGYYW